MKIYLFLIIYSLDVINIDCIKLTICDNRGPGFIKNEFVTNCGRTGFRPG